MLPIFRRDLIFTREEQQGSVYYQLYDPEKQTRLKFYEREYRIAQKLDGQHDLMQIVDELNTEAQAAVTLKEVEGLIEHWQGMQLLESLGLGMADGPPLPGFEHDKAEPLPRVATTEIPMSDNDIRIMKQQAAENRNKALLAGLNHIKQGKLAHARDFLLAAAEQAPEQTKISRLIDVIDSLAGSEQLTKQEIKALWKQCEVWFPDLIGLMGSVRDIQKAPIRQPTAAIAGPLTSESFARGGGAASNRWLVWVTAIGLSIVLLICGGALWLVYNSAPPVHTRTSLAERVPVFVAQAATKVASEEDVWLSFRATGQIEQLPSVGQRVSQHAVVASLQMPSAQQKIWNKLQAALTQQELQKQKNQNMLNMLQPQQQNLQKQLMEQSEKLKTLQNQARTAHTAAVRASVKRAQQAQKALAVKLASVTKQLHAVTAHQSQLEHQLTVLHRRQGQLDLQWSGQKITAPFSGEVTAVSAHPKTTIKAQVPVLHLQNPTHLRLSFDAPARVKFLVGHEATVAAEAGSFLTGIVRSIGPNTRGGKTVEIALNDSSGALMRMNPGSFHLVEKYVDAAFRVNSRALVRGKDAHVAAVVLLQNGRAVRQNVQILHEVDGEAVVYDPANKLGNRLTFVVDRADGQAIADLADGTVVDTL